MATNQMISRKNITLVYKRSTIISFNKNKNTKTIIRLTIIRHHNYAVMKSVYCFMIKK